MSFADRLNLAFAAFLRPPDELDNRAEWTNQQFARAAEKLHGKAVFSAEAVRQARLGTQPRGPSVEAVGAMAKTFEWLAGLDPTDGASSAIAAFLCIDPEAPGTTADDVQRQEAIGEQLQTAINVRDSKRYGHVGLMTRIGAINDPQELEQIAEFMTELEDRRAGGTRGQRRPSRRRGAT